VTWLPLSRINDLAIGNIGLLRVFRFVCLWGVFASAALLSQVGILIVFWIHDVASVGAPPVGMFF